MKNQFQNTFISAIIISSVSLIVFLIFLNIYKNRNHIQKNKQNNTSQQIINNKNNALYEVDSLKKKIISIKNQDSIQKLQFEKDKLNDEIITYVSSVQKHLYSNDKKDLKVLKVYHFKLKEYYKIKGLSVNANRLLIGTIRSIRIEINKIESESKFKTINSVEKINKESTIVDTSLNKTKDKDTLTKASNELPKNVPSKTISDSTQSAKNDSIK